MANIQSPPGFLNIFELLVTLRTPIFEMELFNIVDEDSDYPGYEKIDNCKVFSMHDLPDVSVMDGYLKINKFPMRVNLGYIQLIIHNNGKDYQSLSRGRCVKEYHDEDSLMRDAVIMINLRRCRDLLSGKYLESYVLHNYTYHKLPAEYWSYDENWYRLLLDGCALGNVDSIGDFFGSVYFKTEEAQDCITIFPNKKPNTAYSPSSSSFLINLDTYTTPWLQVLSAVYDKYGKDKLAKEKKEEIQVFIEEYIKKHQLDIASTDIPYLAKFIRLAEQKEGKKYHAKRKKSSEQNNI